MPILAECEECGKKYRLPDDRAGENLPCKACGTEFEVPRPPRRRDRQAQPERRNEPPRDQPRPVERRSSNRPPASRRKSSSIPTGWILGGSAIVLLAGGIVIAFLVFGRKADDTSGRVVNTGPKPQTGSPPEKQPPGNLNRNNEPDRNNERDTVKSKANQMPTDTGRRNAIAAPTVAELTAELRQGGQENLRRRWAAISRLSKIGNEAAVEALVDHLSNATDRNIVYNALKSMGDRATPVLVRRANDKNTVVRNWVRSVIAETGTDEIIAKLAPVLTRKTISGKYLPPRSHFVHYIRVADALAQPSFQQVPRDVPDLIRRATSRTRVRLRDIESVTLGYVSVPSLLKAPYINMIHSADVPFVGVLRMKADYRRAVLAYLKRPAVRTHNGTKYYVHKQRYGVFFPDAKTIVFGSLAELKAAIDSGGREQRLPAFSVIDPADHVTMVFKLDAPGLAEANVRWKSLLKMGVKNFASATTFHQAKMRNSERTDYGSYRLAWKFMAPQWRTTGDKPLVWTLDGTVVIFTNHRWKSTAAMNIAWNLLRYMAFGY